MATPVTCLSARRMQSRASGSSSTISTRTVPTAGGVRTLGTDSNLALQDTGVERELDASAYPTTGNVRDLHRRHVRAVQLREARARVRQTDSLAWSPPIGGRQPLAAVTDGELQVKPGTPRADTKLRRARAPPYPVSQRVLDERLEDERRHERRLHVGIDLPR